ncbi:uncharacterized protein BDV17DRAFT_160433 [Aspergillus undulatus]|uniref:uncharacterized protein n=1 Tax=Aspergillus undulatus TaxID=1810928 RepID=UPI003CCD735D
MQVESRTGLDILRERTIVDCDTLDEQVVKIFGPIQDCTSNQAELSKPENGNLIKGPYSDANELSPRFPNVGDELYIEITIVKLATMVVPRIDGHIHIQTNLDHAYDTQKTIANGSSIVQIFDILLPIDATRICNKVPSTWEGLMACRTLKIAGVRALVPPRCSRLSRQFSQSKLDVRILRHT